MIAGFIFLRLRGILGKRSGYEDDISSSFPHEMPEMKTSKKPNYRNFDESAKKDFIEGAKVAYETIITNFAKGSIKEIKNLLDRKVLNQFQEAINKGSLPFTVQASENILALDGGRTLGWELAEVISSNAIDHLFIQVGGGALLTSCTIGLLEAKEFGILETVPKVCAVQAEGCAPFDRAWKGLPQEVAAQEKIDYAISNAASASSFPLTIFVTS